jgi:hypothetical protein
VADKRAYYKTDVGYFTNPKIAALLAESPLAVILHLGSIAYSAQHLTDGIVPALLVQRLIGAEASDAELLLNAGLWIERGQGNVEIKDYLEHQRSAADAKKLSDAGRKGAASRWQSESDADGIADPKRTPMAREKEREKEDKAAPRPDVEFLCDLLADLIEANGSKRPAITKRWLDAGRLLIDSDKRDPAEIDRVIRWCQASTFWRANVMSMPKLREKYDTLRLQAGRDNAQAVDGPRDQWARSIVVGGGR